MSMQLLIRGYSKCRSSVTEGLRELLSQQYVILYLRHIEHEEYNSRYGRTVADIKTWQGINISRYKSRPDTEGPHTDTTSSPLKIGHIPIADSISVETPP